MRMSSFKPPPLARAAATRSYRRLSSSCRQSLVPQPLARAAAANRSCSSRRSLLQPPPLIRAAARVALNSREGEERVMVMVR
jgi:hypothetical protein